MEKSHDKPAETASDDPLGVKLLAFARAQMNAAEAHLAQPGNKRHSGVHLGRKCLRRTRALLLLGNAQFRESAASLIADIGQLGRGLSPLRDAQALTEALKRLAKTTQEAELGAMPAMLEAARARRDELLDRSLLRDPDMRSRRLRIHSMRERLSGLDWHMLTEKSAKSALQRSAERAEKARKRAKKRDPQHEAWHTYRRKMRRSQQQNTVLTEFAPHLAEHGAAAGRHAEQLGEAQDQVLLLARCGSRSPFTVTQRAVLRKVVRAQLARARSKGAPADKHD